MYPTPRKGEGASDTSGADAPSSEQRKRGRQRAGNGGELLTPIASMPSSLASPSPARRRGCNCKKSGCLKLYCECFAANARCGDRCQCMGCKNREHNKLEIAHAMETIEKRSQRSFKSPLAVARKLETLRASTPQNTPHHHSHGPSTPMDGATRLLMSAERLEETPRQAATTDSAKKTSSECICFLGSCHTACPCHENFGGCGRRCACHHVVPPPDVKPQAQEKTRGCSCKKSNCLKLYCECLAAQRVCDSRCNCEGCKNRLDNQEERGRAISVILERNPMAFQPKVATGATQHLRGCNCRKSNCMKNYCECHQAGVPCTSRCACQGCRNTDAFVSAKKMLIFSGDLKVRGGTSSPDIHHSHAMTPSSAKPPRRPSRRASMGLSSPTSHFRTPTAQPPSALEILSRTAPPAAQLKDAYSVLGGKNTRMPILTKRKLTEAQHQGLSFDEASDLTKRAAKPAASRLNFQDRLEKAAATLPSQLPSVESALEAEFDASSPELPLSKLCRSLLNAATSVDITPTPRKTERSPAQPRPVSGNTNGEEAKQDEPENEDGNTSPMTDDLLCEEDIETPTRAKDDGVNGTKGGADQARPPDTDEKRRAGQVRLAAMQERAVLQEFSVWLRNLTTSAVTLPPPQ